jgi:hypothetical protein
LKSTEKLLWLEKERSATLEMEKEKMNGEMDELRRNGDSLRRQLEGMMGENEGGGTVMPSGEEEMRKIRTECEQKVNEMREMKNKVEWRMGEITQMFRKFLDFYYFKVLCMEYCLKTCIGFLLINQKGNGQIGKAIYHLKGLIFLYKIAM